MKIQMFFLLTIAFVLAVAMTTQAYEVQIIDEDDYEYESSSGTAYDLMIYTGGDGAGCCGYGHAMVTGSEWGQVTAIKSGTTTAYVTSYDPNVDPPIHFYYWYHLSAFVIYDVLEGTPPSGSGSGQAKALLNAGGDYYRMDASLSYSGLEYAKDSDWTDVEDSVDMSWQGAEFELWGGGGAGVNVSVDDTTSRLRGWVGGSSYMVNCGFGED
jgi:hypothetical protein